MSSPSDNRWFGSTLEFGSWRVRLAAPDERDAIMALRAKSFRGTASDNDSDAFDDTSLHLWVGHVGQGPSATARLALHHTPAQVLAGYSAQFYDLSRLAQAGLPVLELGRLCRAEASKNAEADVLRLIWAGVARIVLKTNAKRLVGCTSFPTVNPADFAPVLSLLSAQHVGPHALRPDRKPGQSHSLASHQAPMHPSTARQMPPLLRAYLMLGGWVSDHLVVDPDLATSHIFTCVDIATMPEARKRLLTQLARG